MSQSVHAAPPSFMGVPFSRDLSALIRRYEPPYFDFDPLGALGLVDCGDAAVIPGAIGESYAAIEEAIWRIVAADSIPVALGGDGAWA